MKELSRTYRCTTYNKQIHRSIILLRILLKRPGNIEGSGERQRRTGNGGTSTGSGERGTEGRARETGKREMRRKQRIGDEVTCSVGGLS